MAGLPDPSSPSLELGEAFGIRAWPSRRNDAYARSTGSISEPGIVITKAERHRRKQASISSLEELRENSPTDKVEDGTFAWLGHKIRAQVSQWTGDFFISLNRDIEQNFAPEVCSTIAQDIRGRRHPGRARSLIVSLIAFLLVFGAMYQFVNYLLFAIRASAQCTPSTVYVPVTYTTTVTYTPSPSASDASAIGASSPIITSTIHSTIYSTSTLTNTITVLSASSSESAATATSYVATVTTTQLVSPVSTMPSSASLVSTNSDPPTLTAPTYTSTTLSYISPGVTITSRSTLYNTIEVSNVSQSQSSFGGMGSAGWNSTDSALAGPTTATNSGTAVLETLTATYFWGTGNMTTSTRTTLITTSVAVYGTSTVTLLSTSIHLTSTSSSSSLPAAATALSTSSLPNSTTAATSSSSSTNAGTGSSLSAPVSAGISSSASGSPAVYMSATAASTSSTFSGPGTGVMPVSSPLLSPSSSSVDTNSSFANGLTYSASATPFPSTSTGNVTFASSTTATVVVPVTSTLPSGVLTTMLEITSTTIGLLGTGTTTVSGYFVWNGTTIVPYAPGAPSNASSPAVPTTSGSALVSPVSGSSASSSLSGPYASFTYSMTNGPATTLAASITIPIINSTAALSMLSSVISGLTASSTTASASTTTVPSNSSLAGAGAASGPSTSFAAPTSGSISASASAPLSSTTSLDTTSVLVLSIVSATSTDSSTLLTMISSSTAGAITSSSSATGQGTITGSSSSASSPFSSSTSSSSSAISTPSSSSLFAHSPLPSVSSTVTATSSNPFPASSATATPTACGEHGNFTMTFDDLPNFTPNSRNQTDITQAPPVPNPYHHLTFSNGYVYAPQPSEPYLPSSSPHLAVFLANGTGIRSTHPGEIGDGSYESNSAFWFDAVSAMTGCDNAGPDPCTLVFTGYTYSSAAGDEIATYSQNATVPPCPGLANCQLQPVSFPTSFRSLSGLQVQAFVGNQERMFFLDDMTLGWSNNTCEAGLTRLRYP